MEAPIWKITYFLDSVDRFCGFAIINAVCRYGFGYLFVVTPDKPFHLTNIS